MQYVSRTVIDEAGKIGLYRFPVYFQNVTVLDVSLPQVMPMFSLEPVGCVAVIMIDLHLDDRLAMLVEAEWNRRLANKYSRCVHNARFAIPGAPVEGIEYFEDQKLSQKQMIQFSTCKSVEEGHYLIFREASGNGKTNLTVHS